MPGVFKRGDAVLQREAGARPHLRLIARRQGHREAGRDQRALAGRQAELIGDRGDQIEPGAVRRRVMRQRQIRAMGKARHLRSR